MPKLIDHSQRLDSGVSGEKWRQDGETQNQSKNRGSWNQEQSLQLATNSHLAKRNMEVSVWVASHGSWGVRDFVFQMVIPPLLSFSAHYFSCPHTTAPGVRPVLGRTRRSDAGHHWTTQLQTHGINSTREAHPHFTSLPSSCLLTEEFPVVRRLLNTLATSFSTSVFKKG